MSSSTSGLAPRRRGVLRGETAAIATAAPIRSVRELPVVIGGEEGTLSGELAALHREARQAGYEEGLAQGYADGRRQGEADGRAAAMEQLRASVAAAQAAMEQAARELRQRDQVAVADIEREVVHLALAVCEAVLERELELSDAPARDALVRALALAPDRGDIDAHVHPEDAAVIGAVDDLAPGRAVRIVPDASIERGGCVLRVGACRIDAQIGPALERVRGVLRTTSRKAASDG